MLMHRLFVPSSIYVMLQLVYERRAFLHVLPEADMSASVYAILVIYHFHLNVEQLVTQVRQLLHICSRRLRLLEKARRKEIPRSREEQRKSCVG